ncbi:MAG: DNA-directed RNA polymerase subunit H [Nanoarchaeota archaeon]|nr:DNA-directed RNA polymerase subunit H [Nanoarchaeota archaeon]
MSKINIFDIEIVPEHRILSEEEKKQLLEKYNITLFQLPRILPKDPIIKKIEGKLGDVVEIKRKSSTAKESNYYRVVME